MSIVQGNHEKALTLSDKIRVGLKEMKLEKAEIVAKQGVVFLLDISGSMQERVEGKRKIDHLRDVMQAYRDTRQVCFSHHVWETNKIPEPQSNTDMAQGFSYLQTLAPHPNLVVLVSDGEPDNPSDAEAQALALHIPVNIIFIGMKGSYGEVFMLRLAQLTGGKVHTVQPTAPNFGKQLTVTVAGMLPFKKQ